MKLEEIIESTLIYSGQYIDDLCATLLTNDMFLKMVKRELQVYNRYRPIVEKRAWELYNEMVFTEETHGIIPRQIISIQRQFEMSIILGGTPHGMIPSFYWRYDRPVLYFQMMDLGNLYVVEYMADHTYDEKTQEFTGLSNLRDDYFQDLITARFMQVVGRSRRAFNISELPIETDAHEMVQEGRELYEITIDNLRQNSHFHLAIQF